MGLCWNGIIGAWTGEWEKMGKWRIPLAFDVHGGEEVGVGLPQSTTYITLVP